MPYSNVDNIALSERDLAHLTGGGNVVDQVVAEQAIVQADRIIDAYLRGRYVTPFDPVPGEVVEISATIAKHNLYRRKQDSPPEGVRRDYEDALRLLKDLQAGRASLDIDDQPTDVERKPGRIVTNKTAADRMFPKRLLDRF